MAYIAPNSTIIVCNGVPIDKDYTHTVKFANASEQHTGIISYAKYTFTAQSYQRYDKNTLRIQVNPDNIYDCNYLCFQNASFGNKWFYAFIDSVEYINNVTAEVRYTIDVMQTYLFDYNLSYCYVVREHSATDEIGDNLVPENLPLGDLICHSDGKHNFLKTRMYTVILYVPNYDKDTNQTTWITVDSAGFPSYTHTAPQEQYIAGTRNYFGGGIATLVIPHSSYVTNLSVVIQTAIAAIEAFSGTVVGSYDIMGEIYDDNFTTQGIVNHTFSFTEAQNFVYAKDPSQVYSGIRNKKLYQYPFRKLILTNANGMSVEYHWELFSVRTSNNYPKADFEYLTALLPDPVIEAYPKNYNGNYLNNIDFENKCVIKDFPRQCYTEDSYTQWRAQNAVSMNWSILGGIISSVMGSGASAMSTDKKASARLRGGSQIVDNIGNALAQNAKAQHTPDSVTVQDNSPIINLLNDRFGFCMYDVGVTAEMAKVIDDYFDMYGYATNRVKVPNFVGSGARPIWNYIKTDNLTINGERLPAEAEREICDIYNNGITFWDTLAHVGNYNLNNRPNGQ